MQHITTIPVPQSAEIGKKIKTTEHPEPVPATAPPVPEPVKVPAGA